MKKFVLSICAIILVFTLYGCGGIDEAVSTTATATTAPATEKYADSKFVGEWYNAFATDDVADFTLKADGTALYKGNTKGTWVENGEEISIDIEIDGEKRQVKAYFVISGDGFVARATPQNQHYLDEGKGELQLEFMLTDTTCIDCIKK